MLVKDIMTSKLATVKENDNAVNAAVLMEKYDVGAIPVITNTNSVSGIVTDRDIVVRCIAKGKQAGDCAVSEVMTKSAKCVTPNHTIKDCEEIMAAEQIRRLPVVDGGEIEGIVSLADIARIRSSAEVAEALSDISMPCHKVKN